MHSDGGQIIQGSPDVFVNGEKAARQSDQAMCPTHGMVQIVQGSSTVFVNGQRLARQGDLLSCGCGVVIIQGSPDSFAGD